MSRVRGGLPEEETFNRRLSGQEELAKQTRGRKGLLGCQTSLCKRWGLSRDPVEVCFGGSAGCKGERGEGCGWSPWRPVQSLAMAPRAVLSQRRHRRREATGLGWGLRWGSRSAGKKAWEKVIQLERHDCRSCRKKGEACTREEASGSGNWKVLWEAGLMAPDCTEAVRHGCESRLAPSVLRETEAAVTRMGTMKEKQAGDGEEMGFSCRPKSPTEVGTSVRGSGRSAPPRGRC